MTETAPSAAPDVTADAPTAPAEPLLVLQRSDISHLVERPQLRAGRRLVFVEPGLLDEAVSRGLGPCEYRRLPVDPDFQARAASEAIALATLLDLRLTEARRVLQAAPSREAPLHGWDIGLFFLALQRALVARQIGRQVADFEGRFAVLRPALPQQMYFDSFVGTDLVASDPARFAVVDSYEAVRWRRADAYAAVIDAGALRGLMTGAPVGVLTHVPTCFYDREALAAAVSRRFSHSVDLASPFWDVPLHRGTTPLWRERAGLPLDDALARYRAAAARVIEDTLAPLLPVPAARAAQVEAWADRCVWQAQNHRALLEACAGTRPHLLLSDQDTGLNGPLFALADALGSDITVVPHSGHPSMVLPHARRVVAVERAGYGAQPRTVLGQTVAVRALRLPAKVQRQTHERVHTVCLLLNSLQTEGLSHIDVHGLAALHRALAALARQHGAELILRPKPSAPALSVLASALGVPASTLLQHTAEPLEQIAARSPLCIAWGDPTTGIAPFLEGGSLVLQTGDQRWPCDFMVSMPLVRDGVVSALEPQAAFAATAALMADPALYRTHREAQLAAFDRRCEGAVDDLFPPA